MGFDIQKNEQIPISQEIGPDIRSEIEPQVEWPTRLPFTPFLKGFDFVDESPTTNFHQGPISRRRGYIIAAWSFVAAAIDALVLFSLCCFIFASGVFALGVKLHVVVNDVGPLVLEALGFFVLMISAFYLIFLRSFLGFTLGEWACGLRLGHPKQRWMSSYILKVTARTLLIYATGIVVLPLLSLLSGRDVPGLIVRLALHEVRRS